MKKILTICFSALILCQSASAWGDLGHWTIGEVAQRHLTPKAARALDSAEKSRMVYELVKPDSVIPDTFPYDHRDLLYSQLRNAGYRLAAELNAIFK